MIVGNSKVTPKAKNVNTTMIVKASSVTNTSSMENKEKKIEEDKRPNSRVDGNWKKVTISNPTISLNL